MKKSAANNILQFIKFGIVGVMNTLVDFLVFTLLTLLFGGMRDSIFLTGVFTLIAYACGVLNSFLLNSRWTFRQEYRRTKQEKYMFVLVNAVSWLVSFFFVWLFSNHVFPNSSLTEFTYNLLGYTEVEQYEKVVSILSKLFSAPIVIIVNFLGTKLFVFNGKKNEGIE
jgi:putative flippase GtrA